MDLKSEGSDEKCIVLNVSVDVAEQERGRDGPSRSNTSVLTPAHLHNNGGQQRARPWNSGCWILFQLIISVSQIIASIFVLALSRNENPKTPLRLWIAGYASGCLLSLSLLFLRYKRRLGVCQFQMALHCFFAVWFVQGMRWTFLNDDSSSSDAPNLYRLCVVFLALSCTAYAILFISCALICCFVIISLLAFRENRGASPEIVAALPKYKYKPKNCSEDVIIPVGPEKEKSVPAEDEMCCICLGEYKEDEDLRELPCAHYFHLHCVDKWLKIKASCPLCKRQIGISNSAASECVGDIRLNGNE